MHLHRKLLIFIAGGVLFTMQLAVAQTAVTLTGKIKGGRDGRLVAVSWWTEPGILPAVTNEMALLKDSFYFHSPAGTTKDIFFYADAGGENNFYGMLQRGDSVHLQFNGDTLLFSGRGAVSCRAQYTAGRSSDKVTAPVSDDAVTLAAWYRQQLLAQEKALALYRDSLTPGVYAVIRANVLGETAAKLVSCLWRIPQDSTTAEKQAALYHHTILPALPVIYPSDTTAMAIRYLHFLLQKAEADYFMQQRYQCTDQRIYEWIKAHYSGTFRDRLLAHQLLQGLAAGGQQEELAQCAQDYLSLVQHPSCKQAIAVKYGKIRKGISKGATAPVFSFPDSTGRAVNLSYFSGKVVLLHFYDTGDPLLSSLSEINNCFKKDEVVFLHICCNNSTPQKYPGMQLLSGNQEQQIMEQYNISRYPSLIVIGKNGKIYATRPPDPVTDHGAGLADIIYAALLQ